MASTLAMLVSLVLMGIIIFILSWFGGKAPDLITGVSSLVLGALLGLLGGVTGSLISVLMGTLLFLVSGRALAAREASTGVYRPLSWMAAGAVVGTLVGAALLIEEPLISGGALVMLRHGVPLLVPALVTGTIGMLFWHAIVARITRSELQQTSMVNAGSTEALVE